MIWYCMTCKSKHSTVNYSSEEISLELSHHIIARLAWLIQQYVFLVKKILRTNTENSVDGGLFVTSLIHLVLFIEIERNSEPAFLLL